MLGSGCEFSNRVFWGPTLFGSFPFRPCGARSEEEEALAEVPEVEGSSEDFHEKNERKGEIHQWLGFGLVGVFFSLP